MFALCAPLHADEATPPSPNHYFNDYAGIVDETTEKQLDARLSQLERDTTHQLVVAVFRKLETESTMENFTLQTAKAWGVGQKDKNNGAILFVFLDDRKMRIEVGNGLRDRLSNAECSRIINEKLKPHFRRGDITQGLTAGIDAMITTARGESERVEVAGAPAMQAEERPMPQTPAAVTRLVKSSTHSTAPSATFNLSSLFCPFAFLAIIVAAIAKAANRGVVFNGQGRSNAGWSSRNHQLTGYTASHDSSSGFSSSSSDSSSGSSFSSGGGDFSGGGSSGSW